MASGPTALRLRRVYEPLHARDGARVLVDRLWPRGLSRQDAALTAHLPAVAPSATLRRWYGHDTARFDAFAQRYLNELTTDPDAATAVEKIIELAGHDRVTLLAATRDVDRSHARVLLDHISEGCE